MADDDPQPAYQTGPNAYATGPQVYAPLPGITSGPAPKPWGLQEPSRNLLPPLVGGGTTDQMEVQPPATAGASVARRRVYPGSRLPTDI